MKYIDLDGNKIVKETKQDWLLKEIYERPIGRAGKIGRAHV